MERFELAKSEEERKKDYQEKIDYLVKHGVSQEWKLRELLKEKESDFGLNNPLVELNPFVEKRVDTLFSRRQQIIEEYKAISAELKGLLMQEDALWKELTDINHSICDAEGHRLSEKAYQEFDNDGYGRGSSYWARRCIICGKEVTANTIRYGDCVVKGEEGPKRILYHYNDSEK